MPDHDPTVDGAPCWVDLFTTDQDRARSFYGALFGWASEPGNPEFGGYFNFRHDDRWIAGCMGKDPAQAVPDSWSVYLRVSDARAAVERAVVQGGSVIAPAMDVADLGVMAVLADPGSAAVGLWEPGQHRGFGQTGAPGTPVWFELHSSDFAAAVPFYEAVFGWDTTVMSDTDDFRYTTFGAGDDAKAGILDASNWQPAGIPGQWVVYFEVPDADAACDQAVALGGSLVEPVDDSPYGRLATLADPFGATFKVVAHN